MNLTQLPDRVVEMDAVKRILHSDHGRGLPALVLAVEWRWKYPPAHRI